MEFVIFNKKEIAEKRLDKKLEFEIGQMVEKLSKWFIRYSKPVRFDVHVKKEKDDFRLTYSIDLKSGPVILEEKGSDLIETALRLFKEFKIVLKKHLEKEKRMHKRHKKEPFGQWSEDNLTELKVHKKEQNKEDFRKVLQSQLPSIRNYVTRVFHKAKENEVWMENQYELSDVQDEVYLQLFERFKEHPEQTKDFKKWLYSEVNEVLKSIINEETFNKDYLESYEVMLEAETKSMEETYSVEHDGDYIMLEDLDDPSYKKE